MDHDEEFADVGGPLLPDQVLSILEAVNRLRTEPTAQRLYSQRDDQSWFVKVTDELYRQAVVNELKSAGVKSPHSGALASCDGHLISSALRQVYSSRGKKAIEHFSQQQISQLSEMIHVKYDHCKPCSWEEGDHILNADTLRLFQPNRTAECCDADTAGVETSLFRFIQSVSRSDDLNAVVVFLAGSWT